MKRTKTIFGILMVLFLVIQNSFASRPVPGIGIVVKKNNCLPKACKSTCNHGGGVAIRTTRTGSFSSQLEEGEYTLSFPQDELKSAIERIIKTNYSKSNYEFDGSGVEFTLDNSQIRVKSLPTKGTIYSVTEQNSDFVIIVPEGGAILSGVLNWDDTVITNLQTENRGVEKKDIKRMNSANQNPLYEEQNREGVNPLFKENSLEGENPAFDTKRKGLNAVNVKKGINHWGEKKEDVDTVAKDAEVKSIAETMVGRKNSINNINGGMPNRISMNITVPKQTQGATFGEKVNQGIQISLIEKGCLVLFSGIDGYKINTADKTIEDYTNLKSKQTQGATFGEKVNQGLHSAGSALSQGASLLGGALPGGSIISAAVSSVGNLAGGAGGGAAAASYAKNVKKQYKIQDNDTDTSLELVDGDYELVFIIVEKASSGLKDTLKTQVKLGFTIENNVLKTKHDTAKNSISNIR